LLPDRLQPQFVPTLTEVVQLPADMPEPEGLQAQLVKRVMMRVDAMLAQRMNEAMAEVVLSHLQKMAPLLHQTIESTVNSAVCEAMAQELASHTRR